VTAPLTTPDGRYGAKLPGLQGWELSAGLHRTFIGHVERGETNLSIDTLERLAGALKIPAAELLIAKQIGGCRRPDAARHGSRRCQTASPDQLIRPGMTVVEVGPPSPPEPRASACG